MQFALGSFRAYTPHGGKPSLTPLALSRTSSASLRGRKPWSTCPSPWALAIPCFMAPLRSSFLCSPQRLRRMGGSHHLPGHSGDPSNMGTSLYIPYRTSLARHSSGNQQHGGTQGHLSCPGLHSEAAQIPRPGILTAIQHCF